MPCKYTTAYYYLPSGQRIKNRPTNKRINVEDWGVLPQVNVELKSDELREITRLQRSNESMIKDRINNASSNHSSSSQETIETDPQLATGILVLKSKIIESGCKR